MALNLSTNYKGGSGTATTSAGGATFPKPYDFFSVKNTGDPTVPDETLYIHVNSVSVSTTNAIPVEPGDTVSLALSGTESLSIFTAANTATYIYFGYKNSQRT